MQQQSSDEKADHLFSVRNLSFVYPSGTKALENVSLDIKHGDRIALVGPNGSGKSTLIRHLNGILPAQQGALFFQNQPFSEPVIRELRLRVGILFQDPDNHLFSTTLYDDIAFGPMNQGLDQDEVDVRVHTAAQSVGVEKYLHKPPHHLSFGQKKRAALAAVLAMNPEVLILDEPAANLDPYQMSIIEEILSDFGNTLIIVEHDLLFLYSLCKRAVVLNKGLISRDMPMEDLVGDRPTLRSYGLDFTFRLSCCGKHNHVQHRHHQKTHEHEQPGAHLNGQQGAAEPLIELQHFNFHYSDASPVLKDINLCIWPGETIALIGQNGAGKSTLAMCLMGLVQGNGFFLHKGREVTCERYRILWQHIGMVFQNTADQLFCPSCREEVAFGPQQLHLPSEEVSRLVEENLQLVGLGGYEDRVPLHLSGGEQKRLAIAATLAMQPELLVLDEPSGSLDMENEKQLLKLLQKIPTTKLLITHDPLFIKEACSRVIVLHEGAVIRDYSVSDFLQDQHLQTINGLDYWYRNNCIKEILIMQTDVPGN